MLSSIGQCNEMTIGGENDDVSKPEEICQEYEASVPNEQKMYYDVKTGKFQADISYENYSIKNKVTPMEVFMKWLKDKKTEDVIR